MGERSINFHSVLIVDDEQPICSMLQREIERCGYADQVVTAANGFEALDRLQQQAFQLLIVDYRMPGMNGVELARRVHQEFPQTHLVLMSGYDLTLLQIAIEDVAFDGYLQKPFRLKQVFEIIGALLELQLE